MNMRTRRAHTDENNQVGSMFTSLHTDVEDPVERLHAVHDSAVDAKTSNESNPMVDALKIAGVFSPLLSQTVAGIWARNQLSRFIPLNISTVISNVPGPNFPLYSAGAQMVRYHGLGLLTPGCGVFHLVFSCNGVVTVTVLADREIIPDPEFYRQCLVASFAETKQALLGKSQPTKITGGKVKAKKTVLKQKKPAAKKTSAKKAGAKKAGAKKTLTKKRAAKRVSAKGVAAKTRQAGVPVKRVAAAKAKRKKTRARSTAAV